MAVRSLFTWLSRKARKLAKEGSKTRTNTRKIRLALTLAAVLCLVTVVLSQGQVLVQAPEYWAKTYGGSDDDYANSVQQTSDEGYVVAGDTMPGAWGHDFWVLKLGSSGDVTWQKTYSGGGYDTANSIQQTSDGGYVVAGETDSFALADDFWVLKLDSSGDVTWQKTYGDGGFHYDRAHSVQQTSDGGYIVAGETSSFGAGSFDFWVLKLDPSGDVAWQKTYGGSGDDRAHSVQQTSDGGYIVAGETFSFGAGDCDFWVLKLDSSGDVTWQKTYGGSYYDYTYSVQQTSDGGYVVTGDTHSFGAGEWDFWVLKLDSSGDVAWQKTYGGSDDDRAHSVQPTSDGGYVVVGRTESFGAGGSDCWLLKLDSGGGVTWQKTYGGTNGDFAFSVQQTSDGGYVVAGGTSSFGAGGSDFWLLKLDEGGSVPECPLVGGSDATIKDTSVAGTDTAIAGDDTSVTPADTGVTPSDTDGSTDTQCYYSTPFTVFLPLILK
jgi:uncharacterized delta-60 repeat protein